VKESDFGLRIADCGLLKDGEKSRVVKSCQELPRMVKYSQEQIPPLRSAVKFGLRITPKADALGRISDLGWMNWD